MNWNQPHRLALITALQVVRSREEMRRFLEDLLTEDEIEQISRRFQAADMLNEAIPYTLIQKETGLSSATVARIAKKLNGETQGYRMVLAHVNPIPLPRY